MKINLHIPGLASEPRLPRRAVPALLALATVAGLALLPGEALFLAGISGLVGLGVGLAELRRHGAPGLPHLPPMPDR